MYFACSSSITSSLLIFNQILYRVGAISSITFSKFSSTHQTGKNSDQSKKDRGMMLHGENLYFGITLESVVLLILSLIHIKLFHLVSPHPLWFHSAFSDSVMFQVKVINVPPNKKSL